MLVVSFHSYKGGSCRTSTCLNTLPFLAKKLEATAEHPILVVDTDIDSQGLTYLMGAERCFEEYDAKVMLSNKIPDRNRVLPFERHEFFKYCVPVGNHLGIEDRSVYCLGLNDSKPMDVQDYNGRIDMALASLYTMCLRMGVRAIVYDTASGDQISAAAACKASKVMVCCLRPTKQFCVGTGRFLGRFRERVNMGDEQVTRVIVLPTAVPRNDITILGVNQLEDSVRRIKEIVRDLPYEVSKEFLTQNNFGIPEVERFKWQEDILYALKQTGEIESEQDSLLALDRYESLAAAIIEEGAKVHD